MVEGRGMKLYWHTSPTCIACKQLKPLAKKITGEYGVGFVELDVSQGQAFAPDILSVPTAILAQGPEVPEVVGRLDANYINARSLRKLLEGQMR